LKKVSVLLVILLLCAFILSSCNSGNSTTTPASTTPKTTAPAATTAAATTPVSTTQAATQPATKPATTAAVTSAAATPASGSKTYGGTLRWVEAIGPSSPIGLPAECLGPSGVSPQITEQTLLKEMLDGSIQPNLAASYEVVTDASNPSITFKLQKGVKFHDGTDFNAKAVKWNFESIMTAPAYRSAWSNWKSIEVIDDNTLKINLNLWQNGVIRTFCDTMSYQISPAAFEKNGIDWVRWNMVGTGPFTQKNFTRDVSLTGIKNTNYWESGKPYLDTFQYLFVTDEMTRVALFRSGGAEVVNCNGNGRIANDLQALGYKTVSQSLGPNVLIPDSSTPDSPWNNLKVRQAAEYAIDKESIAKTFGSGWWTPAYQFSTPNSKAYDASLTPRKYDVAKARQLLTDAGYPNGFKTNLIAGPFLLNRDVVLALQSYLGKVGITCELQFPDMGKWSEISQNKWKNGILYSSINEWGNQNVTFNYFLADPLANNWMSVTRPEGWKALLDASKVTPSPDATILKKMEKMVDDNVLCIPIYSGSMMWAFAANVNETGEGTRGQSNWIEPQNTWLSK
jgi:peptide/nickel transport system substrate-binding protein